MGRRKKATINQNGSERQREAATQRGNSFTDGPLFFEDRERVSDSDDEIEPDVLQDASSAPPHTKMRQKQKKHSGNRTGHLVENYEKRTDHLPINKQFAEKYETSKRLQLLSNAPAALFHDSDDASSSSEEDEDEFGELLTKGIDRKVHETLDAIRRKDPKIYDSSTKFFDHDSAKDDSDADSSESDDDSEEEPVAGWDTIAKAAQDDAPKLTMKDYVRETLLRDGKLSDGDDENGFDDEGMNNDEAGYEDPYDKDADEAIANVHGKGKNADNEEESSQSENSGDEDFFMKREKTSDEIEEEDKDFERFLKSKRTARAKKEGEDLLLHSYLEKDNPDEKERFLRDFVLNNGWLDKNAKDAPRANDYTIEIDRTDVNSDEEGKEDEEDDKFDEQADDFEAKYNFRFEDPDGAQIVSHAREIAESMRRPDNRRKAARDARRLRKQQEKAVKTEDIKRLKNLKKKEIQARLLAIQEAAGDGINVSGIDLDGDFDPDEFNKQMGGKFGEEYYSKKDEQMSDLTKEGVATATEKRIEPSESQNVPEDLREDVNRLVDEYYNLDYEDIVGGVPMRFMYKQVEPESFDLGPEDILGMDDKDLNSLVSLKYLAPYRARRDVQKQAWRVRQTLKKRRHGGAPDNATRSQRDSHKVNSDGNSREEDSRRRRKQKRRRNGESVLSHKPREEEEVSIGEARNHPAEGIEEADTIGRGDAEKLTSAARKRKKKKERKSASVNDFTASRKEAYGIQ